MELKTYRARSLSEALQKVKQSLGKDAVILNTRTLRAGGLLGLGGRAMVEITATDDHRVLAVRSTASPNELPVHPRPASYRGAAIASKAMPPAERPTGDRAAVNSPSAINASFLEELSELKSTVGEVRRRGEAAAITPAPAELLPFYERLITQDVHGELVRRLLARVVERFAAPDAPIATTTRGPNSSKQAPRLRSAREILCEAIADMLPAAEACPARRGDRPVVVALVGPAGVGKTTTIAKLAADAAVRKGRRVGLLTVDAHRPAAAEQLAAYAAILDVAVHSASSPEAVSAALTRMADLDLVLVDTPGCAPREIDRIEQMAALLSAAKPDEIHLVLSGSCDRKAAIQIASGFAPLGAARLIFTKLDEAVGFGLILNVLREVDMRLSYLTMGPSVPDDIEPARPRRLAALILGNPPGRIA